MVDKFIENGFKRYNEKCIFRPHASFLLQKRIENDKNETKYFINVYVYDITKNQKSFEFECEIIFYKNDKPFTIIFKVTNPEESEIIAEEFFSNMKMDLDPNN